MFWIPPEDQPAWSDLLGLEPVSFVCDRCGFPAVRTARGWQHAELADAVFCSFVFGTPLPAAPDLPAVDDTCPECFHLLTLHRAAGCTAKSWPAHSLTGEPCPCDMPGGSHDAT